MVNFNKMNIHDFWKKEWEKVTETSQVLEKVSLNQSLLSLSKGEDVMDDYFDIYGRKVGEFKSIEETMVKEIRVIRNKNTFDFCKNHDNPKVQFKQFSKKVIIQSNVKYKIKYLFEESVRLRKERKAYIVLDYDFNNMSIDPLLCIEIMPVDPEDTVSSSVNNYSSFEIFGEKGKFFKTVKDIPSKLIVGQMHGHPSLSIDLMDTINEYEGPSVIPDKDGNSDLKTSKNLLCPIYAIYKKRLFRIDFKSGESGVKKFSIDDLKDNFLLDALYRRSEIFM